MLAQAFEIERRREPVKRGRTRLGEAESAQLDRREPSESLLRDDVVAAGRGDRPFEPARPARLDQLAAEGAHDRVRDGGEPTRPVPDERPGGGADEWVACEALVEAARVVVQREHEAGRGEALLVRGAHHHASVGPLPRLATRLPGRAPRQTPLRAIRRRR